MTKKRQKQIKANTGTNSTKNGKQSPWFTIGGMGRTNDNGVKCASPWNAGRQLPSKRFKKL